jgi:Tfp pilus assembly protein PilV
LGSFQKFLRRENGFTFAELLGAILLLVLGVFAIVTMYEMGLRTASRANVRTVANNLASEKIEAVRNIAYDDITTTNLQTRLGTSQTRSGFSFTLLYDVTIPQEGNPPTPVDYKQVTVSVSWTTPPPASSVSLTTFVSENPAANPSSVDTQAPVWGAPGNTSLQASGAFSAGTYQITLTWSNTGLTDNVGVEGYYIYRSIDSVNFSLISILAPATLSYVDMNLQGSTTYYYYVKAFDAAGNLSNATNTVSWTTPSDVTAPSVPTNLAAQGKGAGSIELTWTSSTDDFAVAGYNIYRSDMGSTPIGTSTTPSFLNTGLTSGTMYTYTVSAYDTSNNESLQSSPASATAP